MKFTRNFELEIFLAKYEFSVKYDLGSSDLQSLTLSELLLLCDDTERNNFENLHLGYTETSGAPELRNAIAATYKTMQPDNILCFSGAEEGIFATMHALLEPGDHAMVTYPNYQSTETIPCSICDVTGIPLEPENNWTIDIDFIKDNIRPNTKLIVINFPNNPTGKILEKDKYNDLIELCRQHGIYLFNDEVYRLIERSEELRLMQASDIYEKGISLNVMSKVYGMGGLRIGWIATQDKELLQKAERVKHYLSICSSAPSEFLATIALRNRHRILDKNRNIVQSNLACLNTFFKKYDHLFDWVEPDGGCIGYPRYLGKGSADDFVQRIVDKTGILFLPTSIFKSELGDTPGDRFRVGFGRNHLPEAIKQLDKYLRGES